MLVCRGCIGVARIFLEYSRGIVRGKECLVNFNKLGIILECER